MGCGCDNKVNDNMIVVRGSHKMRTKDSMVATLGHFYQKKDEKVSHQISFLFHFTYFMWEPMSHLVSYTMLTRPRLKQLSIAANLVAHVFLIVFW